jgi:hypothetical protein
VLWEAGDRVCGKRLKALIPVLVDAMERHGHFYWIRGQGQALAVSAATIDRALVTRVSHIDGQRKRRTGVGAAIRAAFPCARSPTGAIRRRLLRGRHGRALRRPKTDGDFVHTWC